MGGARARRWLDRHGATDRAATPLLQARLDARRRGERLSWMLIYVAVTVILVPPLFADEPWPGRASLYQVWVFYSSMALAVLVGLWAQGRSERRIGRVLSRRVAHPQAVRVATVVGRWFIIAAIVVFGAGALTGLSVALGAGDPGDRRLGLMMLGAIGVFALVGLAGLVQVVRRPAIADDEQSLADDLLLRREDAMNVLIPYPAMLALIAAAQSRSLAVLVVFLGYALAAAAAWSLANWAITHASAAHPAASRSVAAS